MSISLKSTDWSNPEYPLIQRGTITHANLLVWEGGQQALIRTLAGTLLCAGSPKPCGQCHDCRLLDAGTHPDCIVIPPKGSSIGVEQIRQLCAQATVKPYRGDCRIFVLWQADRMTAQAQNALLKTLEEPAGEAYFFLVAKSAAALLPTVISRCSQLHIRMGALPMQDIDPDRAATMAQQGLMGEAFLERAGDEAYWALRAKAAQALELLTQRERRAMPEVSAMMQLPREQTLIWLEAWMAMLRDQLALDCEGVDILSRDIQPGRLKGRFTSPMILDMIKGISTAWRQIKGNVSVQLASDALLLKMLEAMEHHQDI